MILIAGGTGTLGRLLVERFTARGIAVRVLTRDVARARTHMPSGVEVVAGDVRDAATLAVACAGVDTVISAVQGFVGSGGVSPASVDRDGNLHLIDAAKAVGATFVLVSVVGASREHGMELARMKFAAEQYLRASGLHWTIVRATAFLETWTELLQHTARKSGRALVFGRGDNSINFVPVNSVAALVERAALDPTTRGQILEIGGTEHLTLNELAARVHAAAGGTNAPRHVPRAVLRMMAVGLRPFVPSAARQAQAALVLDSDDFTFNAGIGEQVAGGPVVCR